MGSDVEVRRERIMRNCTARLAQLDESWVEFAERMGVHRNTLRYKVRKAAEGGLDARHWLAEALGINDNAVDAEDVRAATQDKGD